MGIVGDEQVIDGPGERARRADVGEVVALDAVVAERVREQPGRSGEDGRREQDTGEAARGSVQRGDNRRARHAAWSCRGVGDSIMIGPAVAGFKDAWASVSIARASALVESAAESPRSIAASSATRAPPR